MPNAVLVRLLAERQQQIDFVDNLNGQADEAGRDLSEPELGLIRAAHDRVAAIDAQRTPLEEFEALRAISADAAARAFAGGPAGQPDASRSAGGDGSGARRGVGVTQPRAPEYRSPGEFVVDYLRARGQNTSGGTIPPDPDAQARVSAALGRDVAVEGRAILNNVLADVPGLLPQPIVGEVLTDLDSSRPFVSSIGVRPLTQPGKTFSRPTVTQHTQVGPQAAEKTELVSRPLKVGSVDFTKRTFGGAVDISRQVIDWSDPAAWDAIITDLMNEYGAATDDAAAVDFEASVTQSVTVDDGSVQALIAALYEAAAMIITGGTAIGSRPSALRLPDTIWTSVDQWAAIGSALDQARLSLLTSPGSSSITTVNGDLLGVPRIMVPGFPPGTIIVGRANRTEFYEERIGLLSAVEPKLLGVEVAYGGYVAYGTLDRSAFAEVIPFDAGGGALAESAPAAADAEAPADAAPAESGSSGGSTGTAKAAAAKQSRTRS